MKKLFFSFAFLVVAAMSANAQNTAVQGGAKIEFSKETHDYGNIKYGGEPYCTFEFKNTGDQPLIISGAKGSCGCTVPEYSKEPVAPGKEGVITATFDSKGRPGNFTKTITVTHSGEGGTEFLTIRGNVNKAAPVAAPTVVAPEQ